MKTLVVILAVLSLGGCAVYPAPAYDPYGSSPRVVAPPVYIYGGGVYRYGGDDREHPSVPQRQPPRPNQRMHDQDRDGVPDRVDADRDGDGVPNRFDRRPDDPRRR